MPLYVALNGDLAAALCCVLTVIAAALWARRASGVQF